MTKLLLIIATLSMVNDLTDIHPLPESVKRVTSNRLAITPDSILISQGTHILELNMRGEIIHEYTFEQADAFEWKATCFAYLKESGFLAVILGRVDGKQLKHQLRFYDRESPGTFVQGFDSSKDDIDEASNVYYKQILTTSDNRIFINQWNLGNLAEDRPLLTEVRLIPNRDGLAFESVGEPFNVQSRDLEKWSAKLNKRWIVSSGEALLVAGEMQPVLKEYTQRENSKRGVFDESEDLLELNGWVQPYKTFEFSNKKTRQTWFNSFSRQVGVYEYGNGLIIGYNSPNRLNSAYARTGEVSSDDAPLFVLKLQRLRFNGANIGQTLTFPGAYFVGVQDQNVWVVLNDDGQYSLGRVIF